MALKAYDEAIEIREKLVAAESNNLDYCLRLADANMNLGLTLTIGVDVELHNTVDFRVAGMLPLTKRDDRFFDSEIQASINWHF